MSQQQVLLRAAGLYSFPNRLSSIPNGALLRAKNIVINRDNIAESRRGYMLYGSEMGSISTNIAHQLLNYKGRILRHWGSGSGQYLEFDNGSGTFAAFGLSLSCDTTDGSPNVINFTTTSQLSVGMYVIGTGIPANTTISSITNNTSIVLSENATATGTVSLSFVYDIKEVDSGLRIKGIEQNGNFYFTTSEGIKKIASFDASGLNNASITQAGGVQALDVLPSINNTPGFLSPLSVVAYRIVWGIKDANQNLILGSPSERVIIRNTDTTDSKTVDLKITIPKSITTSHFYQIYRTAVFSYVNTFSFTGDTTNTSTTIANIADTSSLAEGMSISGTGIPSGTTITSISSGTSIEISQAATATNTGVSLTVSVELDIDPGDEQGLVYEANPEISDLNNGYVVVNDITPESFRGANLYTNADSGEGISQANNIPPLSKDLTSFKGYTFYANTKTKQRLDLSLLSIISMVSGTSTLTISDGVVSNTYTFKTTDLTGDTTNGSNVISNISDTSILTNGLSLSGTGIPQGTTITEIIDGTSIRISEDATATNVGTTITFATESASGKEIALSQLPTPSQQVDETARSLVRIINNQSSEIVEAFYLSGVNDVPGAILLQAKNLNEDPFYLTVDSTSTGAEFSPSLPTSGNSVISDDEVCPNRIYYSKFQQPEAVPLLNYIDVGPKDKAIMRILALRDNLFIFKEEGIYRLSGLTSPFQVYPFDFSTNIKAPDSAVVLNNLIYLFTNQGTVTVSDTGVSIISRPIEDQLIKLLTPQYTHFDTATFGVSYESDRAYYLFTVTNTTDTHATQCFRFNTLTNSWTLLDLSKRCGIVNSSDDKLYLGPTDTNFIEKERKSFDRTDFADREISLSIGTSSISNNVITVSSLTNISVGDVLTQIQYLTIKQFNRLLTKLDRDSLLSPHDYYSTLFATAGDDLSNKLDDLINKIANDSGRTSVSGSTSAATYTALTPTPASFSDQQTTFNDLIALLNTDIGTGYKNYSTSTGTTTYELPIEAINTSTLTITTDYNYPLIVGPITVYNHIDTDLQFVPQYLTDVSVTKQVSEGTYIFEDSSFSNAMVSYSSDLSANFEQITITGNGNGLYGYNLFGNGIYGGNGSGIPFRTFIPKEKQRCRYMNVRFKHSTAREIFSLYGISLTFNPISQRGWR